MGTRCTWHILRLTINWRQAMKLFLTPQTRLYPDRSLAGPRDPGSPGVAGGRGLWPDPAARQDQRRQGADRPLQNGLGHVPDLLGSYPSTAAGLQALRTPRPISRTGKWDGPYIDRDVPLDPWSHPYQYACPGHITPSSSSVDRGSRRPGDRQLDRGGTKSDADPDENGIASSQARCRGRGPAILRAALSLWWRCYWCWRCWSSSPGYPGLPCRGRWPASGCARRPTPCAREWCQARVDAMKSGHTYAFRYLVHGDRYHLGPQGDQSAVDSSAAAAAAADDEELGDDPPPPPVDKRLPQGICFLSSQGGSELSAMVDAPQTGAAEGGDAWSDPIYFYADGSTSDARLLLAADRHAARAIDVARSHRNGHRGRRARRSRMRPMSPDRLSRRVGQARVGSGPPLLLTSSLMVAGARRGELVPPYGPTPRLHFVGSHPGPDDSGRGPGHIGRGQPLGPAERGRRAGPVPGAVAGREQAGRNQGGDHLHQLGR